MATDKVSILRMSIDEQKHVYGLMFSMYQQNKIKGLTFLGGGLGALTFLYSNGEIFLPHQISGQIFYFLGLGMVIVALAVLFLALRPVSWEFPTEQKELNNLNFNSEELYYEYINRRYSICYALNSAIIAEKGKKLDTAFPALTVGVMILVILKIFGG